MNQEINGRPYQLLSQLFDLLGASNSAPEFGSQAATLVASAIGDWGAVLQLDPASGNLQSVAAYHRNSQLARHARQALEEWANSTLLLEKKARQTTAGHLDLHLPPPEVGDASQRVTITEVFGESYAVIAPIFNSADWLGLLVVGFLEERTVAADLDLVNAMAGHIGTGLGHLQRIDASRRMSQQLTVSTLRLESILESIPQAVIVVDGKDCSITSVNRSFARLFGEQAGRAIALSEYAELLGLHKPTGEPYLPEEIPWVVTLRTGQMTVAEEMVVQLPEGKSKTVLCSASRIQDAQGTVFGAVAVLQDISERKEFERQKDEFLAVAAHEFRTPLTGIKGYVQLLQRRAQGNQECGIGDTEASMLQSIDEQASRLRDLVTDLLDYSRIRMGLLEIRGRTFSLGALAAYVVKQLQQVATDRALHVSESGDTHVLADPARIEQVLTNLMSNSLKATESGGTISVAVCEDGDSVVTSVQDDGVGMPAEVKQHIFEQLYRNPQRYEQGMGLGLYISKGIIMAHGGTIWFESEPGKGSTFFFRLPLVRADRTEDGEASEFGN